MKVPYKYKKIIPNILTLFRLIVAPIILIFGLLNQVNIVLILTVIGCFTDLFDGFFARRWKVVSQFGAKLDAVSDKVFASCLLLSLSRKLPILIFIFILEMIISLCNLFYYSKLKKSETLFIGKVKTNALFALLIVSFIYVFFNKLLFFVTGLGYVTINLQILTGISYTLNFIDKMKKIKSPVLESLEIHQKLMEETKELNFISELEKEDFH